MTQQNAGADAALSAVAGVTGGAIAGAVATFKAASSFMDRISSGPSTQKFEVNKDNVLKAATIIQDQAKVLQTALKKAQRELAVHVNAETAGVVSANIAGLWNRRLATDEDSYVSRIEQYVVTLENLAAQLKESARQYGFTEEEITTVFGKTA